MESIILSKIVINLMKGIVFKVQQPQIWQNLLSYQANVIDYVEVMGLELIVDESEGYAYLNQTAETEETSEIPKLIVKRQLSFIVSLLCVLLRKKMIEEDSSGNLDKVIVTRDELIRLMTNFLPEQNNQAKIQEQIDTAIRKIIEIGFLKKLTNEVNHYELLRIIKAFVDAEWLIDVDKKLEIYFKHGK